MYIDLHDGNAEGAVFYRRVYDLGEINDLNVSQITIPFSIAGNNVGVYDISNPTLIEQFATDFNLPLNDAEDGNILTDSIFPVEDQGQYVYTCYKENPESFEQVQVGVKPDDFDTNPHYCWYTNWRAADGNTYYCQVPAAKIPWNENAQYWYDKEHRISKRIYAGPISFYISKLIDCDIGYYNNTRAYIQWGSNVEQGSGMGYQNTANFTPNPPEHNCLTFNDDPIQYGVYDSYVFDRTNMPSSSGGLTMNGDLCCSCFFVKCVKDDEEYVGVGILQKTYSYFGGGFTRLSLRVINAGIYGSIIHDGEPPNPPTPEGTWGENIQPNIPNGTYQGTSDSKPSNYTIQKISERTEKIQTLFKNITGVFSIYLLGYSTTPVIQTESWDSLTKVYRVLYSSDYITRYGQSLYNPLSAVLSVQLMPFDFVYRALFGAWGSTTKKLTISGYNVSDKIAELYSETAPQYQYLKPTISFELGSWDVEKYFDSYADFAPFTRIYLHLPFIGKLEVDTNAVAHGKLTIIYHVDMISGNIVAEIWCKDREGNSQFVHTANGNCAYSIPMYSMNQDGSAVGKLLHSAVGTGLAAITGNVGGVLAGAVGMGTAAIESTLASKSTAISGELGGNNSLLTSYMCWAEIIRPVIVNNMHYKMLHGIQSYASNRLNDSGQEQYPSGLPIDNGIPYDGFVAVESIELDSVHATEKEKEMLRSILARGIHIRASLLDSERSEGETT